MKGANYRVPTISSRNWKQKNVFQHEDDSIEITLLTIYDKGEISSVTDQFIKWLVSIING